ncbi:MAG: hypothetical protein P4L31_04310, partial [Candidatus Babeliales bacterium]|nr:hypothetical protein [Candidatus Babeliales bacterium]
DIVSTDTLLFSLIEVLESCCDELKTSTGFLQSQIDIVSTDTLLFSLIEVLESCCDELKTSTGFLQSQIDIVSTDTLLFSLIEVLESCCDELKTSTGFLQSQIDVLECSCDQIDCCAINLLTMDDMFNDNVASVDWSFDSKFVAIGLSNASQLNNPFALQIYQVVGASLVLKAQYQFNKLRDVTSVRWHPNLYRLAVSRMGAKLGAFEPQLTIFDFDPILLGLTVVGAGEIDEDVFAISWRSVISDPDILAVGRDNINELALYTVSPLGALSVVPQVSITTQGQIQLQALEWNSTNTYVAVGVDQSSPQDTLQVFVYDPIIPSITLNASTSIVSLATLQTALSLDWNPDNKSENLIAVGLSLVPGGEMVQLFNHNGIAGTLTKQGAIDDLDGAVASLDWNPNGKCIAVGENDVPPTAELRTYQFNRFGSIFTFDREFALFGCVDIHAVRWAPNGLCLAVGNDTQQFGCGTTQCCRSRICRSGGAVPGALTIFCNDCLTIPQLVSIVDELSSCCDELRTSTGFLQSQIDII